MEAFSINKSQRDEFMYKDKRDLTFSIIVGLEVTTQGIGFNGSIPWKIPEDMKYFQNITTQRSSNLLATRDPFIMNVIIMGKRTFESIGSKPLPNRINIVISKTLYEKYLSEKHLSSPECVEKIGLEKLNYFESFSSCLRFLEKCNYKETCFDNIFVIGGTNLYKEALMTQGFEKLYVTEIRFPYETKIEFDTYFPNIPRDISDRLMVLAESENYFTNNNIQYKFKVFKLSHRINLYQEVTYFNFINNVLSQGEEKSDRTGVGTLSLFGNYLEFDIRNRFPLFTSKKMFWKGVVEELLWFLSGSTDSKVLESKGVTIWKKNSSKDNLMNLSKSFENDPLLSDWFANLREGDCGPIYGFNWRHFGAHYTGCDKDYSGQGFDQIANIINEIKKNPNSRRLVLTAFDPSTARFAVLPPCHVMCQFNVLNGEYLDCLMFQRSCDIGLGCPFNISSYSLLTYMIAHVCNLKPNKFYYCIGDAHIYKNHIDALRNQLDRKLHLFPQLEIKNKIDGTRHTSLDGWTINDFVLKDYYHDSTIRMDMNT